jgi:hypothetical protein
MQTRAVTGDDDAATINPHLFGTTRPSSLSENPWTRDGPYWKHIDIWKDVGEHEFLSYRWQVSQRS